ncbi:hypothetical protein Y034_5797 [Burkholderia pseudomallei MSHR449]|nr:hypothetical protein Y034_5797 [Burkholderia pseudomallei MSHR449]
MTPRSSGHGFTLWAMNSPFRIVKSSNGESLNEPLIRKWFARSGRPRCSSNAGGTSTASASSPAHIAMER